MLIKSSSEYKLKPQIYTQLGRAEFSRLNQRRQSSILVFILRILKRLLYNLIPFTYSYKDVRLLILFVENNILFVIFKQYINIITVRQCISIFFSTNDQVCLA